MRPMQRTPRRASVSVLASTVAVALTLGLGACATAEKKKLETRYAPSESVLEVVAVLRRHVPDDTYRFPPANEGDTVHRSDKRCKPDTCRRDS